MCKRMSFFSFSCNIFAIVIFFLKSKILFDMKFWYKFFFLSVCILALVGCKDDDDQTIPTLSAKDGFSLVLPYDINKGANLTFTASDDWTISSTGISSWLSFSKTSGGDGENTILVKANNYNCTNEDEHYSFTITSTNAKGTTNVDVTVTHEPVFRVASLAYEADPKGETLHISVKTKANILSSLFLLCDKEFESMLDQSELPSNGKAKVHGQTKSGKKWCMRVAATRAGASGDEYILDFVIKPNTTSHVRTGCFWLGVGNDESMLSDMITVSQKALDTYSSQDMKTDDGKVTQLQKHKLGKGVPIVLLGDGFLDRDITSGKYRKASKKALEGLFSLHPMTALRDYFDVYEVTAVSYNDYFFDDSNTAFSSRFTSNSTRIDGDNDKAMEYAIKAIGEKRIDDAVIVVLINDTRYAGTCSMCIEQKKSDIPNGCSVAYVPLVEAAEDQMAFASVLCHEAIGHGFAKLADEYDNVELVKIPDDSKQEIIQHQGYGCYRNVALDSDVKKSYWADFAADSRYDSEKLGCYEGGATYAMGVYRPTENSIMNDNSGGFNVAGRVMIYKRCMKIAMGSSWKFKLADFIAFDLENGRADASNKRKSPAKRSGKFVPLGTPKVFYLGKK